MASTAICRAAGVALVQSDPDGDDGPRVCLNMTGPGLDRAVFVCPSQTEELIGRLSTPCWPSSAPSRSRSAEEDAWRLWRTAQDRHAEEHGWPAGGPGRSGCATPNGCACRAARHRRRSPSVRRGGSTPTPSAALTRQEPQ